VLLCHASPGSQTAGLATDLDPSVTVERVTRTDARVIACGHTHVADARELGQKLICNPGSCGFAFDGDPAACWALLTFNDREEPTAELMRTAYDAQNAADEVAARGLTGDVYRAATIRTGRFIR
jgi:diadenosine tetraphosphatase ApaH/serine/threonine PP2A family protein phosphatase